MCESGLEFDACYHLEFSPSIVAFESQPTGIQYQVANKTRHYTPDFRITKSTGEIEYIEVKPEKIHASAKFRDEFELKRAAYKALGYKLILVSEKQIRNNKLLENLKTLHRYTGSKMSEVHKQALHYIKSARTLSIRQLANKLGVLICDCIATCALLIGMGAIKADLETELLCEHSLLNEA